MVPGTTRKSLVFMIVGACLVALAIALNISWIVINWRAGVLLVLGIIFFLLIIGGLVMNTIFLVREVRRNEQHEREADVTNEFAQELHGSRSTTRRDPATPIERSRASI